MFLSPFLDVGELLEGNYLGILGDYFTHLCLSYRQPHLQEKLTTKFVFHWAVRVVQLPSQIPDLRWKVSSVEIRIVVVSVAV